MIRCADSRGWVCGRLIPGFAGYYPTDGMQVCLLCLLCIM